MKRFKHKKAQQLVEFLLVVPFMVIILGILTEYAYALNINMTICHGLKAVTTSIYSSIKPGMTQASINTTVESNLKSYLETNKVPVDPTENNLRVSSVVVGKAAIFMARYTYVPAFSLPNAWFWFMPDKFEFLNTTAIPTAFLGANNYGAGVKSETLDKIWSSSIDFSTPDGFNAAKKGILKADETTLGGGRNKMLFMVLASPAFAPALTRPYALVSWNGSLKTSGSGNYVVDIKDGRIYDCSATCTFYKTFLTYIKENKYKNVLFSAETDINLSNPVSDWVVPSGSTDLSDNSIYGYLKNTVCLIDATSLSIGNYDNIDVSAINAEASTSTAYKTRTVGTYVFVHSNDATTSGYISTMLSGVNENDYKE